MAESKRPRVMVDMSATLIHHGHIRLLKKAAEIGEVVVALTSDDEVKKPRDMCLNSTLQSERKSLRALSM